MTVDEKIREQLIELIHMGEEVLSTKRSPPPNVCGDSSVDTQMAHQWATRVQNLLARVFGQDSEHYKNFSAQVRGHLSFSPADCAQGILKAAKDDFDAGQLFDLRRLLEAEVFDDFLEQAEHLLVSGYFQPAAVVAGCVLEDGLRKLCEANAIVLPPKPKLDGMNAELVKAGLYSKLIQKKITALADLRNRAAHGNWQEFKKEDVEEMLPAVRRLMEEHFV